MEPEFTITDKDGETHTGPAIVCRSGAFGLGTGTTNVEAIRAPCPKLSEHTDGGEDCPAGCYGYGYIDHF